MGLRLGAARSSERCRSLWPEAEDMVRSPGPWIPRLSNRWGERCTWPTGPG